MPKNVQKASDDLVNKIGFLGRQFNKSIPPARLEIKTEEIRDLCNELLALLQA